jgi:hypothetical protein
MRYRRDVQRLQFTPDGRALLLACDETVRLLDLDGHPRSREIAPRGAEMAFWGEGDAACLVVARCQERGDQAQVLRWPSLEEVGSFSCPTQGHFLGGDRHLVAGPSHLAWVGPRGLMLVLRGPPKADERFGEIIAAAGCHTPVDTYHCVSLAADVRGRRFVSGDPGAGLTWVCCDRQILRVIETSLPDGHPHGHAISPCGEVAAWCSRRLEFAETTTRRLLGSVRIDDGSSQCHKWAACFLPGSDLVFGAQLGRWWGVNLRRRTFHDISEALGWTPRPEMKIYGMGPGNAQLAVSPNGERLAVGCYGEVRVLDVADVRRAVDGARVAGRLV